MSKKSNITDIRIKDIKFPNVGIGEYNGLPVHIKNTLPGQLVSADLKKKSEKYEGLLLQVIEQSPHEIIPKCPDFNKCGGCMYQNIPHEYELQLKEQMVLDLFRKSKISVEYLGIEPSPNYNAYRNKMEYSFGDEKKDGDLALGMRKRQSNYEVVTAKCCSIVHNDYEKIVTCVLSFFQKTGDNFYKKTSHIGSLRNLVIRRGEFTKELLINIVTTDELKTDLNELTDNIIKLELSHKVAGILHTVNNSLSDAIKCDRMNILYGDPYYYEKLFFEKLSRELTFKISVFSFFQTNSAGAVKLYEAIHDFAGDCESQTILDLYCGTGTISQVLSYRANEVTGIELSEEAVVAARENAKQNEISNCTFISGDVLKIIDSYAQTPDIIVVDPPREGIHPKALSKIINLNAEKIIYVSCNPVTLVRDLRVFLDSDYICEKMKIHDMFPMTGHVECVVMMKRNRLLF